MNIKPSASWLTNFAIGFHLKTWINCNSSDLHLLKFCCLSVCMCVGWLLLLLSVLVVRAEERALAPSHPVRLFFFFFRIQSGRATHFTTENCTESSFYDSRITLIIHTNSICSIFPHLLYIIIIMYGWGRQLYYIMLCSVWGARAISMQVIRN